LQRQAKGLVDSLKPKLLWSEDWRGEGVRKIINATVVPHKRKIPEKKQIVYMRKGGYKGKSKRNYGTGKRRTNTLEKRA